MLPKRFFRSIILIVFIFGGWTFHKASAQSLSLTTQVKSVTCFGGSDGSIKIQASGNHGPVVFSYLGIPLLNAQLSQLPSGS